MPLSAVCVLVVAQSSSEIPEGLMNNSVHNDLAVFNTGNNRHILVILCQAVTIKNYIFSVTISQNAVHK